MTFLIKIVQNLFSPKKSYFYFDLSSREKKKIILNAVKESNKMQVAILNKYAREYPDSIQKYYKD